MIFVPELWSYFPSIKASKPIEVDSRPFLKKNFTWPPVTPARFAGPVSRCSGRAAGLPGGRSLTRRRTPDPCMESPGGSDAGGGVFARFIGVLAHAGGADHLPRERNILMSDSKQ